MYSTTSSDVLLTLVLAAAVTTCRTDRQPQSDQPLQVSVAEFQTLRWLEGTWRGTGGRQPFYEGYRFQSDTLVWILYFADSTTTRAADSGAVYLRAGIVYHEADGGLWRATHLDSVRITFEPVEQVTNSFTWVRESADAWLATLQEPGAPEKTYRLERVRP